MEFLLPFSAPTPSPNTKEGYKVGFIFLYRNKRLAFHPFCFPILGLNLANGERVEAVKLTQFMTRGTQVARIALSCSSCCNGCRGASKTLTPHPQSPAGK